MNANLSNAGGGARCDLSSVPNVSDIIIKIDSSSSEYQTSADWRAMPESEAQIVELLQWANENGVSVVPQGGGTKDAFGSNTEKADLIVSLKRMSGIVEHSVGDLTVTVLAGTPLRVVQEQLKTAGQFLPLDPAWGEESTIGGIVNSGASGPMRAGYGSVRDLLISSRVVYPSGQVIRTGAKVVKNVAGYDMNKLFIGSMGTLGIHTEFTFKIRPIFPGKCLLVLEGTSDDGLRDTASKVRDSHLEPLVFEWLNRSTARLLGIETTSASVLLIGFADVWPSVDEQVRMLQHLCAGTDVQAVAEHRGEDAVDTVLESIRRLTPNANRVSEERTTVSLKMMGLLTDIPELQQTVDASAKGYELQPLYSGGLLTGIARATIDEPATANERLVSWIRDIRESAKQRGVRTIVEFAPKSLRRRIPVWGDAAADQFIMNGIKQTIDPRGILNPQRLWGGII